MAWHRDIERAPLWAALVIGRCGWVQGMAEAGRARVVSVVTSVVCGHSQSCQS